MQVSPEGIPGHSPFPKIRGCPHRVGTGLQQGGDGPGNRHLQPNPLLPREEQSVAEGVGIVLSTGSLGDQRPLKSPGMGDFTACRSWLRAAAPIKVLRSPSAAAAALHHELYSPAALLWCSRRIHTTSLLHSCQPWGPPSPSCIPWAGGRDVSPSPSSIRSRSGHLLTSARLAVPPPPLGAAEGRGDAPRHRWAHGGPAGCWHSGCSRVVTLATPSLALAPLRGTACPVPPVPRHMPPLGV